MHNIAIIGGSGFIGEKLIEKLLDMPEYNVVVLDLKKPKSKVKYLKTDITDENQLINNLIGIDIVVHLAAIVGVDYCNQNPEIVEDVNFNSVKKIVNVCIKNKVKKFIFSSSSEVYGDLEQQPLKEECKKLPISTYAKSKLNAEKYIKSIDTTMERTILRFFNAYGEVQREDFVINKFISQALRNQDILIHGDGNQIRCFTYISDIIDAIYQAIIYRNRDLEVFNIGNNVPISINDLAKFILDVTQSQSKVIYEDYGKYNIRKNDIKVRIPDISKAQEKLEFIPKISWQEGVRKIVTYKKNILSTES